MTTTEHAAGGSADDTLRCHVRAGLAHAGLSQAEASRCLGVSTKHLSQMLTGRAPLTLAWAERLLGLCGMRLVIALEYNREDS